MTVRALVGWQRQAVGVSVQGLLEAAGWRGIEGREVAVCRRRAHRCRRARPPAQVASCRLAHAIPVGDLRRALNAIAPPGDPGRSRRGDARGLPRTLLRPGQDLPIRHPHDQAGVPFLARYAWLLWPPLDVAAMDAAARLSRMAARHDFAAFQSAGSSPGTTVRTMTGIERGRTGRREAFGGLPRARSPPVGPRESWPTPVTGAASVRHMVRAIVGSLVEVGRGRQGLGWFEGLLRDGRRDAAGPTAPAHGLFLAGVHFDGPPNRGLLARGSGQSVRFRSWRFLLLWLSNRVLASLSPGSPEESLAREIDFSRLPVHVAIIMDGNGRWAAKRHLPRVEGHRAGIDAVREDRGDVGPPRRIRPDALRVLGRELEAAADRGGRR